MCHFKILILCLFSVTLYSNEFEKNCKSCHFQQKQLEMFMARYTLKYSSEEKIKKAMFDFIKNPSSQNSVMPSGFLKRWGLKPKTDLSDKEIKKSLNLYYQKYNILKLLK